MLIGRIRGGRRKGQGGREAGRQGGREEGRKGGEREGGMALPDGGDALHERKLGNLLCGERIDLCEPLARELEGG